MFGRQWLAVLFLIGVSLPSPNEVDRLLAFRREAEKTIGKRTRIEYNVRGIEGGQTRCELNPVEIKIGPGVTKEIQDSILAHEFGHVILCSRDITVSMYRDPDTPKELLPIMLVLGTILANCYIDPLADREAELRGFNFDKRDAFWNEMQSKWMSEESPNIYGRDYVALSIYCAEIREKKPLPILEEIIPRAEMDKLRSLKQELGMPTCKDKISCYILTKKLRDQFIWAKLLPITNPETHKKE